MTTTIAITITVTSCVSSVIIMGLLMLGTALGGNLHEKIYRWFFVTLLLNAIGSCLEGFAAMLVGLPGENIITAFQIADFFSYALGSLIAITFSLYVYEYLSLKKTVGKAPFIFMIFCLFANIVFIGVGQATKNFVLLDANNNYDPQGLTMLAQILPLIMLLTLVAVILRNIKFLKPREWVSLLTYAAMPILCYSIENIWSDYPLWITYFGVSIVLLLVYVNIQVELKHKLIRKDAELTESRVAIMLTQIQPHFIHNSLLAIQDLCGRDAKEAEKAVKEFSKYLRGNLSSLTNKKNISFEQELEHLRLYLKLEQRRFEERLQVEYDIQAAGFELPALTLQPIVENAVLHGVTQKTEGGKIFIKTREDTTRWRIIVEDTGVGFDPNKPIDDSRPHIGIQNVRYRLDAMCGGTLEIESAPGVGTTAAISIPKGEPII